MIQHGTVREVNNDRIVVGCVRDGGCTNCSSAFCSGDESLFEADNPKSLIIEPGDRVEIYLSTKNTVVAGFVVLILPLVLFAIGYLIASKLKLADGLSALFGLIGLCTGFALAYFKGRAARDKNLPAIISVIQPRVGLSD